MYRYYAFMEGVKITNIMFKIVRLIPKRLRYFVTIDSCAKATVGEYGNTVPCELDILTMINRSFPRDSKGNLI